MRASRVTVDDQPITMSLLREEKERLEKRIELYRAEEERERQNRDVREGQVRRGRDRTETSERDR